MRNSMIVTMVATVVSAGSVAHADDADDGTLIVKTNAAGGRVLINDEAQGTVKNGKLRLELPEGRYRLAIEAEGFTRKELDVLVTEGETTLQTISLEGRAPAVTAPERNVWKPIFVGSLAATVGTAAFSIYGYNKMKSEASQVREISGGGGGWFVTNEDCGRPGVVEADGGNHFASACAWSTRSGVAAWATIGLSAVTAATAYMAFVHKRGESRVVVAPTVSTEGAGASMQMTW